MTGQERYVSQQQDPGTTLRGQNEEQGPQNDVRQQPNEAAALRTLAQSLGNTAMTEVLSDSDRGVPLEPRFREDMERNLGANLSKVRVHDDAGAHASAASLDANAYTVGQEIILGPNAESTSETAVQDLLAHELVHVVQQGKAATLRPELSGPADPFEQEADSLSKQARRGQSVSVGGGASVPGVQRQPAASVTKRVESPAASREEVRQAILVFLQKAQGAQGGGGLRITDAVKTALRMLAAVETPGQGTEVDPGKAQRLVTMESLLTSTTGDPADLANRAAQILPEPFDRSALQKLQKMPVTDPQKSTVGRVADLARKEFAKPEVPSDNPLPSPEQRLQEQEEKMRAARGLPQPHGVGPVKVDLFALGRFIRDLPGTVKPKTQHAKPQAQAYPEVDQAIQKIAEDALIPSEARGKSEAGNFADAREVAAHLARELDVAQQEQRESVELRLPEGYNQVKDREAMINAVVNIVQTIRRALQHHGSAVKFVDIYFGDRLAMRSVGSPSQ